MTKTLTKKWEEATQDITDVFILNYFGKDADWYWISDEIGSVLFVNDYFFNFERILEAVKFNATSDLPK
jgi:hypothetical protein